MIDINVLVAVSIIWAVAVITPGPNFFITVHTAVGTNRKLSMLTVMGIVAGTLVWSLSGYLGIALLFKTVPMVYFFLKIVGGLYLIGIGIRLILKRNKEIKSSLDKHCSAFSCFRVGLFTNLLNPKTAAFMTSLFAATIPADASIELGVMSVMLICVISALWYSLVSVVFSYEGAKRIYEKQKSIIEKIAGTIFIGFGIKLAISK